FGVGVLAGFLLGDKMEISTRYIRSQSGIRFSVTLDLEATELRFDPTLSVGTTIRILVSSKTYQSLKSFTGRVAIPKDYDWYNSDKPIVTMPKGPAKNCQLQNDRIEVDKAGRPLLWRKLHGITENFEIYWAYQNAPALSVNGIYVTNSARLDKFTSVAHWDKYHFRESNYEIQHPKVCVHDPDGVFPLNLQRSNITEKRYPFKEENLIDDIIDDLLAYLIIRCPDTSKKTSWVIIKDHPAFSFVNLENFKYICATPQGIIPACFDLIEEINVSTIQLVIQNRDSSSVQVVCNFHDITLFKPSYNAFYYHKERYYSKELLNVLTLVRTIIQNKHEKNKILGSIIRRPIIGVRVLIPSELSKKFLSPSAWINDIVEERKIYSDTDERVKKIREEVSKDIESFSEIINLENKAKGSSLLATSNCPETKLNLDSPSSDEDCIKVEIFLQESINSVATKKSSKLSKRWRDIIKSSVIPFDTNERQSKLKQAYHELEQFIKIHREMVRKGVLY
ncbi:MAG: hypothetical protein ACFFDN_42090, partial [Candidatus Hodarchaeota archaeon]